MCSINPRNMRQVRRRNRKRNWKEMGMDKRNWKNTSLLYSNQCKIWQCNQPAEMVSGLKNSDGTAGCTTQDHQAKVEAIPSAGSSGGAPTLELHSAIERRCSSSGPFSIMPEHLDFPHLPSGLNLLKGVTNGV